MKKKTPKKKAKRNNKTKPKPSLISPIAMIGLAEVMTSGLKEYGRYNWQKGLPWTETVDSLMRHTLAFLGGEDFDESGHPHVDHIQSNAMILAHHFRTKKEFDDRDK
jgi:hypothetical protein